MPLYENSVIYKLVHKNDQDNENIYVGSTTNFRGRKLQHKVCCYNKNSEKYNRIQYKFIRENGGWDEWEMIAIETYPCENKRELEIRERFHIEKLKAKLNKNIPTRTPTEHYEDNKERISERKKQYNQENRDKILEQKKEYYQKNRDELSNYYNKWKENNIDKWKEYQKKYKEENDDKIKEQRKKKDDENRLEIRIKQNKKVNCECGCIVSYSNFAIHRKSDKHKKKMEELNI